MISIKNRSTGAVIRCVPSGSLEYVDLARADLRNADLQGMNLVIS
jgi:hypothetical protein